MSDALALLIVTQHKESGVRQSNTRALPCFRLRVSRIQAYQRNGDRSIEFTGTRLRMHLSDLYVVPRQIDLLDDSLV